MPTESTMLYERSRPSKANRHDVGLTAFKGRPPTPVSIDLDLWAKVTIKIEPGDRIHRCFAHDEAPAEPLEVRS